MNHHINNGVYSYDCHHQFDWSIELMSCPPQVRCIKCGLTMTKSNALIYEKTQNTKEVQRKIPDDVKSLWKQVAVASLEAGLATARFNNNYKETAIGHADEITQAYVDRFGCEEKIDIKSPPRKP